MIKAKINPHLTSGAMLHCIVHRFLRDSIKLSAHRRTNREGGGVRSDHAFNVAMVTNIPRQGLERGFQISHSVGSLESARGEPGVPGCFICKAHNRRGLLSFHGACRAQFLLKELGA